jgi:hypothetical protein
MQAAMADDQNLLLVWLSWKDTFTLISCEILSCRNMCMYRAISVSKLN